MYLELAETRKDHGSKTYRSDEYVAQEKTKGTTVHEGGCCSKKETCTDDTTNTGNEVRCAHTASTEGHVPNHGDMTILELAMKGGVDLGGCCLALDRFGVDIVGKVLLVAALVGSHGE